MPVRISKFPHVPKIYVPLHGTLVIVLEEVPCAVPNAARHIPASLIPACRNLITPSSAVANAARAIIDLMRATIKRDIDTKKLNEIIDDIEVELRSRTLTAVTSHELGDMVLKRLAKIDKVAYIRFASVYRDFKDVDEFLQELDKLR